VITQNITCQAKGLNGRPGIGMKLGRCYVEYLKDTRREVIKKQRHMQVREETSIHIEEGRLRGIPTAKDGLDQRARLNSKERTIGIRLQNWKLVQKLNDRGFSRIDGRNPGHPRIYPVDLRWGDDLLIDARGLTTPLGLSSLTTSTGGNTWIALTDRGSVVEDSEEEEVEEEEEEDEEHIRRGEREGREAEEEEEEVGRDKEDMTNLTKATHQPKMKTTIWFSEKMSE